MLFVITGKRAEVTEAIRKHAVEKTSKLQRYYNSINHIEVVIKSHSDAKVDVEIIARAEHNKVFVVTETGEDIYTCIDIAVHKLESQLKKKKGEERDNKRSSGLKSK